MVNTARAKGAAVSITVRMDPAVKAAIAQIPAQAWQPIEYTDAIYDEDTDWWISRAEVAEIQFTAFTSKKKSERLGTGPVAALPRGLSRPQPSADGWQVSGRRAYRCVDGSLSATVRFYRDRFVHGSEDPGLRGSPPATLGCC